MNDNRCALLSVANLAVHPSLGVHAPNTSPLRVLLSSMFRASLLALISTIGMHAEAEAPFATALGWSASYLRELDFEFGSFDPYFSNTARL